MNSDDKWPRLEPHPLVEKFAEKLLHASPLPKETREKFVALGKYIEKYGHVGPAGRKILDLMQVDTSGTGGLDELELLARLIELKPKEYRNMTPAEIYDQSSAWLYRYEFEDRVAKERLRDVLFERNPANGQDDRIDHVAEVAEQVPECVFVKTSDNAWRVCFGGKETGIPHLTGMSVIQRLLSDPGREVENVELHRTPGAPSVPDGTKGPVVDRKAVAEYGAKHAEIVAEIGQIEKNNDQVPNSLYEDKLKIEQELEALVSPTGRIRTFGSSERRKAKQAVEGKLDRALKKVESFHPALAAHLQESIKHTPDNLRYDPSTSHRWVL